MTPIAFDVVVPTFGKNNGNLSSILQMEIPPETSVEYYIISDNHGTSVLASSPKEKSTEAVHFLTNHRNMGASASRNRGIDVGTSEYVLFLDDDVEPQPSLLREYKIAIEKDPDVPGFVGLSRFPVPINSFTRGTLASDILTFWTIAETRSESRWGITANLLVQRRAIGSVRFSSLFPKRGGGEDIDFCLNIIAKTGRMFQTAPKAIVHHGWWSGGSRQYRRFARWAYGDGRLPQLHRRYRYWNTPNLVETLSLGTPIMVFLSVLGIFGAAKVIEWLGLIGAAEFGYEIVRLGTRPSRSMPWTSIEAALVRISNDIGRLAGNLKRRHFLSFGTL